MALSLGHDELRDILLNLVDCRSSQIHSLNLYLRGDINTLSFIERLSSADNLPSLQELSLSWIKIPEEVLSRLILRFRESLRKISFHLAIIAADGGWSSTFREWKGRIPLLDSITVGNLRSPGGTVGWHHNLPPTRQQSSRPGDRR